MQVGPRAPACGRHTARARSLQVCRRPALLLRGPRGAPPPWRAMTRRGGAPRPRCVLSVLARERFRTRCALTSLAAAGGAPRAQGARAAKGEEAGGARPAQRPRARNPTRRACVRAADAWRAQKGKAPAEARPEVKTKGGLPPLGEGVRGPRRALRTPSRPHARPRSQRSRALRATRRTGCTATRPFCATSTFTRRCRRRPWAGSCCPSRWTALA